MAQRELKFRAWVPACDGGMCMDHDVYVSGDGMPYDLATDDTPGCPNIEIESHPEYIVMQFTGLKDRNGKEIYEGDVLAHEGVVKQIIGRVEFEEGEYWVIPMTHTQPFAMRLRQEARFREVIGNIHENPELLKP
jgi:uncharacterized phage protein (TIGR01671 family)